MVRHLESLEVNASRVSIILDSAIERYWKKSCREVAFDYDDNSGPVLECDRYAKKS
jgi:hypothetical protein